MSYKVAITSSNGEGIDQHFGQANSFHVLQIEEETGEWKEIEIREVVEETIAKALGTDYQPGGCSGHNDAYLNYLGDLLSDCVYLLTEKIGKRPYKILRQKGINCLESPNNLSLAIAKLNKYYLNNKK